MPASPQILLPLERRSEDRFDTFVSGPNDAALSALIATLDSPGSGVFLRGPRGSGKSHLLNALCNEAQTRSLSAFYIALAALPEEAADGLAGLEQFELVCVDDIDSIAGCSLWEEALFHCFNRLREAGSRVVLSSTLPLAAIPLGLPDLRSRAGWGLRLALEPLDDAAKAEVLVRRARAAGIELPAEVRNYLLSRGSRQVSDLVANLEAVREAALKAKRRLTVPLAREVLRSQRVD